MAWSCFPAHLDLHKQLNSLVCIAKGEFEEVFHLVNPTCGLVKRISSCYLFIPTIKMQVPLHLLCDDLLLCQEATGNMYKLTKEIKKISTGLFISPKEELKGKHLDLRKHELKLISTAIRHTRTKNKIEEYRNSGSLD